MMRNSIGLRSAALVAVAALLAGLFILLPGDGGDETAATPQAVVEQSTVVDGEASTDAVATSDGADTGTAADLVAPIDVVVPAESLETGPSAGGAVELSDEGQAAVSDLATILGGRLPASAGDEQASPAEPQLPATAPATAGDVSLVGPTDWRPGGPIEVALRIGGDQVQAVETLVAYDSDGLTFGGVDETAGQVQVLINDRGPGLAVAAYACGPATCDPTEATAPVTELQLRFVPETESTSHTIDVGTVRLVNADGSVADVEVAPIVVGDGAATDVPGARAWELAAATTVAAGAGASDLDHTLDGRIDQADLAEAVLAWHQVRREGSPCVIGASLARHDVNGDGCVDVADLRTVIGSDLLTFSGPLGSAAVTVPTPSGGSSATGVSVSGTWAAVAASGFAALAAQLDFDPYQWPSRVGATTHVVTVTSDEPDAQLNDGICANQNGECTLRAAILQSNADAGPNRIEFNIPGAGPHTIQLSAANGRLPVISDMTGGVTIDGYSQPGSSVNTHEEQFLADIRVQIAGIGVGDLDPVAFTITSPDNVIRGLAIHSAHWGVYLEEDFAERNHIVGNIIGTDVTASIDFGTVWASRGSGVFVSNGPKFNVFGTPDLADRNVFAGNASWGIRMDGGGTDGNIVWNNIFDLTPDGSDNLPNNGGIDVQWRAQYNVIGGLNVNEGNVFSGSNYTGVDFSHQATDNYILGNLMGTTLDGTSAPTYTTNTFGVILKDDAYGNYIIGNVISNSRDISTSFNNGRGEGIWGKHDYTGRNTIIDNYIGLTIDGQAAGSERHGIFVNGHDDIIENNVIAFNANGGVHITEYNGSGANADEETRFNRISKNSFYANGGLGIDINPVGQSTNDSGDGDTGPNDRLNFPEFTSVAVGSVSGTACAGCEVEIYLADGSNFTQGQVYLGTVVADGGGNFSYADAEIVDGKQVTALAIDTLNNTSEFTPAALIGTGGSGGGAGVAWTSLSGMSVTNIGGTDFAVTADNGVFNNSGADATSVAATFDVVAPAAGLYRIEALVYAPSGGSDSFWVAVDGDTGDGALWDMAGTGSGSGVDLVNDRNGADPVEYFLSEGSHTIRVALREDGAGIATVALVSTGVTAGGPPAGSRPPENEVITPPGTPASDGGRLETVTASVADGWTPVAFAGSFTDPVATCTVRYENNASPVVVRMQNLTGTGMELRLQNPGDQVTPVADTVDCLVAEAGAWNLPDGTAMQAFSVDLSTPDHIGSWNATQVNLSNTFASPMVVLGQVMTNNDAQWSQFWSRGNSQFNPPTPTRLQVGYHVGEDPNTSRAPETIGVIVLDASHGTLGGVEYEFGRTGDIVTGPTPATHTFSTAFAAAPTVGVVSQSAMDGNHGSWIYLNDPPTATGMDLLADEDQVLDAERTHPNEMAGYAVFASPLSLTWGATAGFQPGLVAHDDFDRDYEEFWGVAPFGGAWQHLFGETARQQFDTNGRGMAIVTPGKGYEALLGNVYQQDIDTTLIATVDTQPDANFDVNVHHRYTDSKNFLRARVRLQSDGSVRVQVVEVDNGVFTSLGAVNVGGLGFTAGQDLAIRVQTVGNGTSTMRIKVWDAAEAEPFGWSFETTTSAASLQTPGAAGLRFQIQSSSSVSSAIFSVDDVLMVEADS
ncbi:MAG: hypothetical protein AAGE88_09815 [Actinomycetota bacterium]